MRNIIHFFRGFESMKRKLERSRDVIKIGLTLTARLFKLTVATEILWIFSLVSLKKKHHKTTFTVKISV